ncbi:rhodanese-like domain-containing protein [Leptolyngbya sp. FACHB-671]|uniref:rhodanese-like domain-containing protein n=1 Tax=Leptolyngbya sp. FACHB-671 TaxID=2692812 RepID=UPI00168398A0|nr:rhodanese-like domain-containing protein [Leptolyngbya sp. FACHB-671]MBD2069834.1 rhodanese-like domain-containing protein [Leptolyngbya sp. FACHB-671]
MNLIDRISWAALERMIHTQFPAVRQIESEELAARLEQTDLPQLILLDTRNPAEFAVSHLANARQVDPKLETFESLRLPLNTPIVTYCSVGYRSSAIASRLQAAGYSNVVNLKGSIFQWANQGRPLYRNEQIVQQVHPYNSLWGRLLDAKFHAYEP